MARYNKAALIDALKEKHEAVIAAGVVANENFGAELTAWKVNVVNDFHAALAAYTGEYNTYFNLRIDAPKKRYVDTTSTGTIAKAIKGTGDDGR